MQHRQQLVFEVLLPIFEPLAPAFELVRKACGNGSVVEEHLVNDAVGIARGVEVRLEVRYVVEIPYLHPVEKGLDLAARKLGILEHGDADIGAKGAASGADREQRGPVHVYAVDLHVVGSPVAAIAEHELPARMAFIAGRHIVALPSAHLLDGALNEGRSLSISSLGNAPT